MKEKFNIADWKGLFLIHFRNESESKVFFEYMESIGLKPFLSKNKIDCVQESNDPVPVDSYYDPLNRRWANKSSPLYLCAPKIEFSDYDWHDFEKTKMTRPTKDEYYLHIAETVSESSTCNRRRYGAVIVKDDRIISTGYNGSAKGETNCCDVGYCYRTAHNLPHGSGYTSDCPAVHAEANAIMQAGAANTIGATLYLAGFEGDSSVNAEPCVMCRRAIKNAQIKRVVAFTADRQVVEIKV